MKNTPEPVAEYRYRLHMDGWRQGDSLRKAGKKEEGEELFRNTSFHLDHGQGMDVYSVGPRRGCVSNLTKCQTPCVPCGDPL